MRSKYFLLISFISLQSLAVLAQAPGIVWQKTIGGSKNDSLVTIQSTTDGGFIVSGHSNSDISGNKTQNSFAGSYDYWVVKLDANGNIQWNKTIGGTGPDLSPTIIQVDDGGYLLGGTSKSDSTGNKTENSFNEGFDYWVVKLDASGNIQWNNTIGGLQLDALVDLAQDPDKSYILAGYSHSKAQTKTDKKLQDYGANLWPDYWVVKLKKSGHQIVWQKVYGGSNKDQLTCMRKLTKGYIFGGFSYSPGPEFDKSQNFIGNNDYWMVKVDSVGTKIFDKEVGGIYSDYLTDIQNTSDGGYFFGGYSNSPISGDKTQDWLGYVDYWVVKVNSAGTVQWDKTLGGTLGDYLSSVQQTIDGGYLIGGTSASNISATKSANSKGLDDYWIVKLNSSGQILWDKTIGGSGNDRLSIVKELSNGEYIAAGTSNSPVSGDKTNASIGGNDYWIVRLSSSAAFKNTNEKTENINIQNAEQLNIKNISLQATPNPTKGFITFSYSSNTKDKLSLIIYNESGKTIFSRSLQGVKGNYTVDLTKFSSGTYYAVLSGGNNYVTRLIVKER